MRNADRRGAAKSSKGEAICDGSVGGDGPNAAMSRSGDDLIQVCQMGNDAEAGWTKGFRNAVDPARRRSGPSGPDGGNACRCGGGAGQ